MLTEKKIIIAICGPSASGKDTLIKAIEEQTNIQRLISDTTRPSRNNEKNGVDYNFISTPKFLINKNTQYLEWTEFRGWYYGTNKTQIETSENQIFTGVFSPSAIEQILKNKNIMVIPVLLKVPLVERLRRSYLREKQWKIEFFRRACVDLKDFYFFNRFYKTLPYRLTLKNYHCFPVEFSVHRIQLHLSSLGNFL